MPAQLTTLAQAKIALAIPSTVTSKDARLTEFISAAAQAILDYCGWPDFGLATYTEAYTGDNAACLPLRQYPIQVQSLTGTLTNGSPIVTGLASTAFLFPSQSCYGNWVGTSATIASVDSASQITLSAPATNSGATSLKFGSAVWLDAGGYAGGGPGAFASTTLLTEGVDYYLEYAQGLGVDSGATGLAYRIGTGWDRPWKYRTGLITPLQGPEQGNIRVQYNAGFPVLYLTGTTANASPVVTGITPNTNGLRPGLHLTGSGIPYNAGILSVDSASQITLDANATASATVSLVIQSLPASLQLACEQVAACLMRWMDKGEPLQSEGLGGYNYALRAVTGLPDLGSARQILSKYKRIEFA